MPEFQIVMRAGPTPGKVFPVSGESFTIGREPGNGIVINDAEVSRKHARMWLQGTTYSIEDLGSTNGTFVNGIRLTGPHALRPGEVIAFGEQISVVFEAVPVSDPNATMLHAAKPTPEPAAAPVSKPVSQPIPSIAGQVPAGPEPVTPEPKKGGSSRTIIIVVLVLLILCICCACLGFFYWVDSGSRWCQILPFLVPLFGGACP